MQVFRFTTCLSICSYRTSLHQMWTMNYTRCDTKPSRPNFRCCVVMWLEKLGNISVKTLGDRGKEKQGAPLCKIEVWAKTGQTDRIFGHRRSWTLPRCGQMKNEKATKRWSENINREDVGVDGRTTQNGSCKNRS